MAGAAGSNIFLLTLCLGISLIFDRETHPGLGLPGGDQQGKFSASSVQWPELVWLEISSLALV